MITVTTTSAGTTAEISSPAEVDVATLYAESKRLGDAEAVAWTAWEASRGLPVRERLPHADALTAARKLHTAAWERLCDAVGLEGAVNLSLVGREALTTEQRAESIASASVAAYLEVEQSWLRLDEAKARAKEERRAAKAESRRLFRELAALVGRDEARRLFGEARAGALMRG